MFELKHGSDDLKTLRRDTNDLLEKNSERARRVAQQQYEEPEKINGIRRTKKYLRSDGDSVEHDQDNACRNDIETDSEDFFCLKFHFSCVNGHKHFGRTVERSSEQDFDHLMNYRITEYFCKTENSMST